jgi:hypothetical protein
MSLKPNVQRIADIMNKELSIDKTGVPTVGEGLFEKTLPENLTMDVCENVGNHNSDFIAAGAHTTGMLAVSAMKAGKNLTEVAVTIPMSGKDSVDYRVLREKTFPGVGGSEPVTKHGVVQTSYDCYAGSNKGGLKAARDMVAEHAATTLGKK